MNHYTLYDKTKQYYTHLFFDENSNNLTRVDSVLTFLSFKAFKPQDSPKGNTMKTTQRLCLLSALTIIISGCSSNKSYDLFSKNGVVAKHKATGLIKDKLTIITSRYTTLSEHLPLANLNYKRTDKGDRTSITTHSMTTGKNEHLPVSFVYEKTTCKLQYLTYLEPGKYIDNNTKCLMGEGMALPINGTKTTYSGTYTIAIDSVSDKEIHTISINRAESLHRVMESIWSGEYIADQSQTASENGFYSLFTKYNDDPLTFKFPDISPNALQHSIIRHTRFLSDAEKNHVDNVNKAAHVGLTMSHGIILKNLNPEDGLITFRFTIAPYKTHGSYLKVNPEYYPSSSEITENANNTLDFYGKRLKILDLMKMIRTD